MRGDFSKSVFWAAPFRSFLFIGVFILVAGAVYQAEGQTPAAEVLAALVQASRGDASSLTNQALAVSLAWLLGAAAFGALLSQWNRRFRNFARLSRSG